MGWQLALKGSVLLFAIGALTATVWTPEVRADVWLRRGESGVLEFTNVPTTPRAVLLFREPKRRGPAVLGRARRTTYDDLIGKTAARYGVEYALVKAVIHAESAFNYRAVSPKGALGLMQLMPATARRHGVRNVFSPEENIKGGVEHLRMLLDLYHGNVTLALAAYNAGSAAVEAAGNQVPPYRETREYIRRVLTYRVAYNREALSRSTFARR